MIKENQSERIASYHVGVDQRCRLCSNVMRGNMLLLMWLDVCVWWSAEWSVRFATLTRLEVVAKDLNGRADDRRCARWPRCGGFGSLFQFWNFLALLLSHFQFMILFFCKDFIVVSLFLFVLCIWSLWLVNVSKVCVYWLWKDRLGVMQIMGRSHLCRLSYLLLCYGDDDCLNQLWCKMLVME